MRLVRRLAANLLAVGILLSAAPADPRAAPPAETFSVPWRAGNVARFQMGGPEEHGARAAAGSLPLTVYRPEGAGPFPFVVLLHGCTDLMDPAEWEGWVQPWVDTFREHGVGTAVVQSLRPRGVDAICGGSSVLWPMRRADDAYSAYEWLAQQPFAAADQIALLGMSNGGRAVLAALRTDLRHSRPFRAGIALYPNCEDDVDSRFYAPLLVLIGDADSAAPAYHCEEMQRRSRPPGPELALVVYPNAGHVFDTLEPGQPAAGPDWEAGIDARRQVIRFLVAHGLISAAPS
jgi:dienelactone hydrolase